jgi:NAD(P)-dependent dehydrogenase (short-subunit alcohol dehydrogenase family)
MSGRPAQSQPYPGETGEMTPQPRDEMRDYAGRGLLEDKHALVTGGDSGIGRAVAVGLAKEGADVAITYLAEDTDAARARQLIEREGRRCLTLGGDMYDKEHTRGVVRRVADEFGRIDVLVAPKPSA